MQPHSAPLIVQELASSLPISSAQRTLSLSGSGPSRCAVPLREGIIMPHGFLDLLERGVVLGDGAMGTQLYERGVYINRNYDELNSPTPT